MALLDGYSVWLLSGDRQTTSAGRIGKADVSLFPKIDLRTRDQYLHLLKRYLAWSATRYLSQEPRCAATQQVINAAFVDVAETIERRFESHIPFPERVQLRNWLMIEPLLETGMRRGELLKLYTTDINQGARHAYVSIVDREHDPGDPCRGAGTEDAKSNHGDLFTAV